MTLRWRSAIGAVRETFEECGILLARDEGIERSSSPPRAPTKSRTRIALR